MRAVGRPATLAALPAARVVEVSVGEWPQRGAPRWLWWEPWSQIDFPAIRHSMQAAVSQDGFDVVWAYSTLGAPLLEGWSASVRIVDLPELHDVMRRRHAALGSRRRGLLGRLSGLRWKSLAAIQTRGWRRVQKRACAQASLVTVCSEIDRTALGCEGRVVVVPNGYEVSREPAARADLADPARTLVFQGTMTTEPNLDAAVFFARDVFPLIRQSIPDAQLRIVGRASPEIRRLSGCEGIVVVGAVERIEDELAKAHAVVVPLRIGSGTRLKILEAWTHGIPVVSTTIGAEGLPAAHAENLLLADSAPALAKECVRVLTDERLRTRLAEAGRRTVESKFDLADIRSHLLAVIRAELDAQKGEGALPSNAPSARRLSPLPDDRA